MMKEDLFSGVVEFIQYLAIIAMLVLLVFQQAEILKNQGEIIARLTELDREEIP